jgi:hypothetical protein
MMTEPTSSPPTQRCDSLRPMSSSDWFAGCRRRPLRGNHKYHGGLVCNTLPSPYNAEWPNLC